MPIGIEIPSQPNIADTPWLTVSDQKNRVCFYQDTKSPGIVWADMKNSISAKAASARKLQLAGNPEVTGDHPRSP